MSNNPESQSDRSGDESQSSQKPDQEPQQLVRKDLPPSNKTPAAEASETSARRFDGSEYLDEDDRAEF